VESGEWRVESGEWRKSRKRKSMKAPDGLPGFLAVGKGKGKSINESSRIPGIVRRS
jgi:hypothetical protein